jgi:hypothetical protein
MASIFSSRGVDEPLAYEIAMMPGMTQLFSLLKIEQLIHTKAYDAIVLDMPASDAKKGDHPYLDGNGGASAQTSEFMEAYNDGYMACGAGGKS